MWSANRSGHADAQEKNLIQRVETSNEPTDDYVVEFESVVRYLRAQGIGDHLTILESLYGAVHYAEQFCNRTFRASISRVVYFYGWAEYLPMPFPPLLSVSSVKYYDYGDSLQTMDSGDYSVVLSDDGAGKVVWELDYSFPTINPDRPDPVQITCGTGYRAAEVPPIARTAIRMLCESLYDGSAAKREEAERILQPLVYRGLP